MEAGRDFDWVSNNRIDYNHINTQPVTISLRTNNRLGLGELHDTNSRLATPGTGTTISSLEY